MPVQLHLHAAGPLDDGIYTNGILERLDQDAGAGCARRGESLIHVGNEVSGPLEAKWIRDRSRIRECGDNPNGAYDGLKLSAACSRRHGRDDRFTGMTAEGGNKAGDEGI